MNTPSVQTPHAVGRLLTINEVHRLYKLSPATVNRQIAAGEMPSVKIAGRRLIPADHFERLIAEAIG